MSTPYPDLPQLVGSLIESDDGTQVERAVSGKPRLLSLYSAVQLIANIQHELDGPQKDQIVAHWANNRGVGFAFKYRADGQTYQLMYTSAPRCVPVAGTDRWSVVCNMVSP